MTTYSISLRNAVEGVILLEISGLSTVFDSNEIFLFFPLQKSSQTNSFILRNQQLHIQLTLYDC